MPARKTAGGGTTGCEDRGPPELELDPKTGKPPLIYNYKKVPWPGLRRKRSMRPSVGYAQEKLNIFLAEFDQPPSLLHRWPKPPRFPGDVALAKTFRSQMTAGNLVVDCWFGDQTELATKTFQAAMGLNADGKIGPLTWPALISVHEGLEVLGVPAGEGGAPAHLPYPANVLGVPAPGVFGAPRPHNNLPWPILDAHIRVTRMPSSFVPICAKCRPLQPPPSTDPKKYMSPGPAVKFRAEGTVVLDRTASCDSVQDLRIDWVQIVRGGDDWMSWYTTGPSRNVLDPGRLEAPKLPRPEPAPITSETRFCIPPWLNATIGDYHSKGDLHVKQNFYDQPAATGYRVGLGGPGHTGFASEGYSNIFDLVIVLKKGADPNATRVPLAHLSWGLGYCVTFDLPSQGGSINSPLDHFTQSPSRLHGPPGFRHSVPSPYGSPSPTQIGQEASRLATISTVPGLGHASLCKK